MPWLLSIVLGLVLLGLATFITFPNARLAVMQGQAASSKSLGKQVPNVTLPATMTGSINLRTLKKPVVIVFYPGDNTPGCTIQLCALRDNYKKFQEAGAEIVGVNPASVKSHQNFAERQNYPFPLISDPQNQLAEALNVSSSFGFLSRTVFVLDKEGLVRFSEPGMPSPEKLLSIVKNYN